MYIQLQINFDKMLIFNISILKQATILKLSLPSQYINSTYV